MPSVLINFGEERKVYDAPDTPVPWQNVVEVAVGQAPTVDVYFKSATQEVHVKTFKFKTQKERRVAVTIAVDADNTVTTKLVTLNDPVIVTLYHNGLVMTYTRTSKREVFPMSLSDATEQYLDAAAAAAALAVPPSQASAVYIIPFMACLQYNYRKRMVQALESAGYTNVGYIEQVTPMVSTALKLAKLTNQVGDYVGVGEIGGVHVVRKTDQGYDYVQDVLHFPHLRSLFPTIKEIIEISVVVIDDNLRKILERRYHPLPVKFATLDVDYLIPYMWNKHDGGNMDGYLVTMTVQCKFRINYNGKNTVLDARAEMLPWQKTVELNIGDAMTLDVFMDQIHNFGGEDHVKQFKFTSKKSRKVSVSIAIDDARLPEVKLTTL
uniref:MG3 domain-containing protein n=1 Tax=Panagrellus redivivus TaxID=6233 RepID=A0A7E5A032_PANRE